MPFFDLSSLLNRHVQRKGLAYQVEAAMSLQYFDTIIDQLWSGKMKDRARALYLKDHVLTVAVLSPVLGQELKNREAEIID
ncbi:MAG: hypothetical protein V1846_04120, partial [Candidatus Komeilibacteria bacterium]